MRRRDVVALIAGATILRPLAVLAQQKAMPVIGWLSVNSPPQGPSDLLRAIHEGLSETGFVEGQDYAVEYRWAEGNYERLPRLAAELISRKVDLIIAGDGTLSAATAKSVTSTIPIVFIGVPDPVGLGLVASLARPGGNVTGFAGIGPQLVQKRFELLLEFVPQAKVIALLVNPNNQLTEPLIRDMHEGARTRGVEVLTLNASSESEIDVAFATLDQQQAGGLIISADGFLNTRYGQLAELALRHAVPASSPWRSFTTSGGLLSYGINPAAFREVGIYAGKILKGAKPSDLPVQQPTKFEMVINMKTAKALGLTVPQSILARADEVIE
jgi:putative ABC transport system substrate-binding protein